MTFGDESAMPLVIDGGINNGDYSRGLTKREYFAAIAMQGWLSGFPNYEPDPKYVAKHAVEVADALIEELNKPEK